MNQQTDMKCRYFNQGFCKKKNNCKYVHTNIDCDEDCAIAKCPNRHRIQCRNGDDCYYNSKNECEFLHDNNIQIIKCGIKEENRKFRSKVEELNNLISIKDNEILEIKSRYNQIFEQNKIAFERIEKLEKRLNEETKKTNNDDMEITEENNENIELKIRNMSQHEIKCIKQGIKEDISNDEIQTHSEKINGKKTNIYKCKKCEITINGDKAMLCHMSKRHAIYCDWSNCEKYYYSEQLFARHDYHT